MGFFPTRPDPFQQSGSGHCLGCEQQADGRGPVVCLESADGLFDVPVDSLWRDRQLPTDLFRCPMRGGKAHTLPLARRQAF